ncbi:MAG: PDZ domain-containing protein, partial [candidate division KSB1 bacterium]|nr:PDZ domain-containing protein [candidate division KSB1 bacterium]
MRTHQWKKFFISREFRIIGACLAILPALGVHFFQAGDLTPDRQHAFVAKVVTTLLTQHHYSHPVLNDSASSVQLDQYLEYLDANRLYFLAADLAEFERYRFKLDDELASGNVETAFLIFNKFKRRANERFTYINNLLEHEFDFSLSEYYMPNREGVPWVHTVEELNELWRKRLKHEALSLKLAGKNWPEIATTLKKRYANLQRRIEEFDAENVFQSYMNALSESFDPHTSYLSPITSQNFNIEMSLSLEGIGARLVSEDEYTKVFEIVTGGPADRSKQLFANDKIVGVAQGEDGPMIDVIGMKLDDVVQMIRGKKGTVVRLEIISASSPPGSPTKTISLVRDKIVLTDREVRSDTIEWSHNSRKHKIGVITIPTF